MDWKQKITIFSFILIPIVFVSIGIVYYFKPFTTQPTSDPFLKPANELGPGGHVLIENLTAATIVAPDRPHDPSEAQNKEVMEKMKRRRVFQIRTNSQGLRGGELGKKSGYRILCVGESVTFGWGVEEDETYPARLSVELNVEVINAGVPAQKPIHMANWIRLYAKQYEPDLILFTARPDWSQPDPWNNFISSIQSAQKTMQPIPVGLILPPISTFDPRGLSNLQTEKEQLRNRLTNVPYLELSPAFRNRRPNKGVIMETQNNIQKMISVSTGEIIAQGPAPRLEPGKSALAEQIVQAFEADESLYEPLMFDGAHPDKEGFVIFAKEVAKWVKKQGWVK